MKFTVPFAASAMLIALLPDLTSLPAFADGQPACTNANVDNALSQAEMIRTEMWKDHPNHSPAYFQAQATALYAMIPACETLEERAALDDTHITRMGFLALAGYCDIALSETAARKYQLGRDALTACLSNLDKYHAVAVARKCTTFFVYEKRFKPILEQTDPDLTDKGFPPEK